MSQYNKLSDKEITQWKNTVKLALDHLSTNGWPARNNSIKFDVVYKDKRIPPKQVIAFVFDYFDKNNIETSINRVAGGENDTNDLLRDLGLIILPKKRKLKEYLKHIDVWEDWKNNYKEFVPKFIEEASKGLNYTSWTEEIFKEFFEKSNQQCVSSLKQGYFTSEEKMLIKKNWYEISPLLKDIAESQHSPSFAKYIEVKEIIRKYTKQDRRAATNRLIASIQPQFLCTIVNHDNLNTLISHLNSNVLNADLKITNNWFESSNDVLNFFLKEGGFHDVYDIITYPWQLFEYFSGNHHLTDNDMSENRLNNEIIDLLKYKKQIILQGPPGTGKTREAKLIAKELIGGDYSIDNIPKDIDKPIIQSKCLSGTIIESARDGIKYTIGNLTNIGVEVKASTDKIYVPKYNEIEAMYSNRAWEKEGNLRGGNDSYSAAVAKFIYKIFEKEYRKNYAEQFKILQFHPSYTYEDFVRGIVSKPNVNGDGVIYEAQEKILGDFALQAFENFNNSKMSDSSINKLEWVTPFFDEFINIVKEELDAERTYFLTEKVEVIRVTENSFKYSGVKRWNSEFGLKFKDIIQAFVDGNNDRSDIKNNNNLSKSARQDATYIKAILDNFKRYISGETIPDFSNSTSNTILKNYVLIVDEINRANLSSVLGELIYALEYRGEAVESMYAVEGENKLTLPPNLYIIGTMNTADRSVGHIDYAIRRRFAFVDVLPKDLSEEDGIVFDSQLFYEVSELFDTNLSPEFEKKDVQLGHSYFIDKSEEGGSMAIRLQYEIKPILLEYFKDGVLIGENIKQKIEALNPSI